jgi:hypothetical protein
MEERVLKRVIHSTGSEWSATSCRLFVYARNVTGVSRGLYEWQDGQLVQQTRSISERDIQLSTIGQSVAAKGAATLWLLRDVPTNVANYEWAIATLGVLGQRIALAATLENLGVFLTPAVYERQLVEMLGLEGITDPLVYVFTLGYAKSEPVAA